MNTFKIRNARANEYPIIGNLLVKVYSQLDGFPKPSEQPKYYELLANIGEMMQRPGTEIIVAADNSEKIAGVVVYFSDMQYYGSGGTATQEKNSAGFRFLGVDPDTRGAGIGKLLTHACIEKARDQKRSQLIIHTTQSMQTAWKMYEGIGFRRSEDLDFIQGSMPVYGFRLTLP